MAPLTFDKPLNDLPSTNFNDFAAKINAVSSSFWRGFKIRVFNLAAGVNSVGNDINELTKQPLTLTTLAKAVKKSVEIFLKTCVDSIGYLHLSAVHLWHSFLLKRERSLYRQKVQTWVRLSPEGCLLGAAVAAAITTSAIATLNRSYKKRWMGYAGLTCTAAAIVYFV